MQSLLFAFMTCDGPRDYPTDSRTRAGRGRDTKYIQLCSSAERQSLQTLRSVQDVHLLQRGRRLGASPNRDGTCGDTCGLPALQLVCNI